MKDIANESLTVDDIESERFLKSRGLKFPNDPRFLAGRHRMLLRTNAYEEKESIAALKVINKDDTVIELGAGLGYMSSLIAKKCQPEAIHSFEANPALLPYIEAVHRANDVQNVTVRNALLGSRKAKARDFFVRGDFLASSLEDNLGDAHGGVTRVAQVEVLNINTVLKEINPTVMVCDIEGAEVELFQNADLSCLRAAIVELHPQWVGQKGIQAVFDAMAKSGLTYFPRSSNGKVVMFKADW